jgi:hypothetical protein
LEVALKQFSEIASDLGAEVTKIIT